MDRETFIKQATEYLSGEADEESIKKLKEELTNNEEHQQLFQWIKKSWESRGTDQPVFSLQRGKEKLLNKLRKLSPGFDFQEGKEAKQVFLSGGKRWIGIAAVILLLFVSIGGILLKYYQNDRKATIPKISWVEKKTLAGQRMKITLGDGSTILLNAESKVTYPKEFNFGERKVFLEGEAYFEVKHNANQIFLVEANGIETQVLGTKFNVKAYEEDELVKVSLTDGKVKVIADKQSKPSFLLPGEQFIWDDVRHKHTIVNFNKAIELGWKDNHLVFENTKLSHIARILERHYGVKFQFANENLKNCRLRGDYRNVSLKTVLDGINYSSDGNIKYVIDGKQINILGKGLCQ